MKGPMPTFKTIDDYISIQPIELQRVLTELRSIILEAVPDAKEVQNYKVPAFKLVSESTTELQLMMMASSKFVSFYPYKATIERFSEELAAYKSGKGSVNFALDKPLPKDLIINMVRFRKEEILSSLIRK